MTTCRPSANGAGGSPKPDNPPLKRKRRSPGLKSLDVPTRYLTPELVAASLVFGKNQLVSTNQDFTSLTEPRVYHYHLQGWNIEEIP